MIITRCSHLIPIVQYILMISCSWEFEIRIQFLIILLHLVIQCEWWRQFIACVAVNHFKVSAWYCSCAEVKHNLRVFSSRERCKETVYFRCLIYSFSLFFGLSKGNDIKRVAVFLHNSHLCLCALLCTLSQRFIIELISCYVLNALTCSSILLVCLMNEF